jgi:hypothetical protein
MRYSGTKTNVRSGWAGLSSCRPNYSEPTSHPFPIYAHRIIPGDEEHGTKEDGTSEESHFYHWMKCVYHYSISYHTPFMFW